MAISLAALKAEHFSDQVGSVFRIVLPEHQEIFTLESVVPGPKSPDPAKYRDQFSLFFKGESKTVLINQQIVPMETDKFGHLEIFVVPVGRNEDGSFQYQAVFA